MKKTRNLALAVLLALALISTTAAAITVPQSVVAENRDGRQLIVKTYTLPPGDDPAELIEEPFQQEGFLYALLSITQTENPFSESKLHSEIVTVETVTDDLAVILEALPTSIEYTDGGFAGILKLDHTSLRTEVTGYTSKSYTITETKTIEGLDRNDPSYIPATTVKNGRTLNLYNVEWSVQGTSLSGDALVPTSYMAVATYTAKASGKVANGYVTEATYAGEVVSSGIASITYTVTYLGEAIAPVEPAQEVEPPVIPWAVISIAAGVLALFGLSLWRCLRSNTTVYLLDDDGIEYNRIGKVRLSQGRRDIDVRHMAQKMDTVLAVSIEGSIARKLFGRRVVVQLHKGAKTHVIAECRQSSYWLYIDLFDEEETLI